MCVQELYRELKIDLHQGVAYSITIWNDSCILVSVVIFDGWIAK